MHKNFADYYRLVAVDADESHLERRWQGIEAFNKSVEIASVLDLIRLCFGLRLKSQVTEQSYREAFKQADGAFLMRDNALELQALAGVSLIDILETKKPSTLTDATALAVVCTYCRGKGPTVKNADVIGTASSYLAKEAIRVREVADVPAFKELLPKINKQLEDLEKNLVDNTPSSQFQPQLMAVLKSLLSAIKDIAGTAEKATNNLSEALKAQREETNIVWWLFGEASRDINRPMKEIQLPAACLVVAKELADLADYMPGPYSSEAYLDRMLNCVQSPLPGSVAIKDAVGQAEADWKNKLSESASNWPDDLCPIHHALLRSVEVGNGWIASFDGNSFIKAKEKFHPLDLAAQFYYERLLLGSI